MKRIFGLLLLTALSQPSSLIAKDYRFALLTDLHLVPGNEADKSFREIVKAIETHNPDFVFVTGDLTNQGNDSELMNAYRQLNQFKMPLFVIPGNHETTWSESAGQTFNQLWKSDRFYFENDDYRFCGINTGPFMRMSDGIVKNEDLRWLDAVLGKSQEGDKPVIFFCHYPMQEGLGNYMELTKILRKYPVEVAFCGHEHRIKVYDCDSIPQVVCEALYSRKGELGYTMVDLTDDSAKLEYYTLPHLTADTTFCIDFKARKWMNNVPPTRYEAPIAEIKPAGWEAKSVLQEKASIFTGIEVAKDRMVYGTSEGMIVCRHLKDTTVVWQHDTGHALFSAPVVAEDKVIVGSARNEILALDFDSGKTVWRIATDGPVTCEGTLVGNMLFIGAGKGRMLKVDVTTGEIVWSFAGIRSDARLQGAPAVRNGRVVFGAWDTYLYCLDSETGRLCWKWNNGKKVDLYSPGNVHPVIADNRVLIVAPDRYVTILDLASGAELFRSNRFKVRESLGYSTENRRAYAKTMDGSLISFDFPADSLVNLSETSLKMGYEHNPCVPLITDNVVYSGSRKGEVVITSASDNRYLGGFKCGYSSVIKFVKDDEGNVWANLAEGSVWRFKAPRCKE